MIKTLRTTIANTAMVSTATALLIAALLSPVTSAADKTLLAAGKKLFQFRCAACHTLDAADTSTTAFGPHLESIVGRQAGSVEGYDYEFDLMREQAFAWDAGRLEAWLEKPQDMVPGMCLPYFGLRREGDRAALMAYMQATQ